VVIEGMQRRQVQHLLNAAASIEAEVSSRNRQTAAAVSNGSRFPGDIRPFARQAAVT